MIVCYSGTGNSRYAASLLADRLQDTVTDAVPFLRSGEAAALTSEAPWVFVSPTYAWRLPRLFADFLRRSRFSGSRDAYFVMTCGSEAGAPEKYLRALCDALGLRFRGLLEVIMPENYVAMFPVPAQEAAAKIVAAAVPVLEGGAEMIRAGADLPPRRTGLADRIKSGPVNPLFYRFCVRARPFRVTDACVSCGRCAAACPLGNIRMEAGRPVWGAACTHCMACICGCPKEAIEYGSASRGKPRWQCPPYRP